MNRGTKVVTKSGQRKFKRARSAASASLSFEHVDVQPRLRENDRR
jgi:hypothetical protein